MASFSYTEELTCPVCLSIFTDPVILPCGHAFCRECITGYLSSLAKCPQCLTAVPAEGRCLVTSPILRNLSEKEAEKLRRKPGNEEVDEWLCPEHEEKLKLFCATEQQLACIICRDGEKHEGHKFKPIKEAAASVRRELEAFVEQVADDICAVEGVAKTQKEEIRKTKEKSLQLMTQIHTQFEEMHQFLRMREDEIRKDLKKKEEEAIEKMSETLNALETSLSKNRELEEKVTSVLTITDYEKFLKSWTKENSTMTDQHLLSPIGRDIQVVTNSLYLGPHESHLKFFMWKEMLQVIQPRAEELSLETTCENITVSEDGKSLIRQRTTYSEDTSVRYASVFSSTVFTSGQYYWEIEVGERDYWKVGVQKSFLSFSKSNYITSSQETELTITGSPQRIGIYLDCLAKELSFFDAESMTLIHTMRESSLSAPGRAYIQYKFSKGADHNPPRVCWF
uniref:Uncharacterized protein n=1 Tax=Echeneis naucrates TaxID=173247 RepID=A0A665VLI7_ECHNA